MTRTLRCLLILAFLGLSTASFAQEIAGRVLDDQNQPAINASIRVTQGGILKGQNITNIDGMYSIKPLDPGTYEVTVQYIGYDTSMITGVLVSPDKTSEVNIEMHKPSAKGQLAEVKVTAYKVPLVDKDCPSCHIIDRTTITQSVSQNVLDIAATSAGVYQSQKGAGLNIGGARTDGTLYIIDGVQVQGSIGVEAAQGSVDQIEVMSSGVSAKYGDFTGGVVNITSRGVSQKLTGDIALQHSIDGYNNNFASFSLAGPVFKKTTKDGAKKPVMGFSLSGTIYDDHDRNPTYDELPVLKSSALQQLQQNPLHIVSDNSGNPVYNYSSDYVTANDWTYSKIPPNNVTQEYRLNGRLDLQVADNMNLSAGGSFDYSKIDQYNRGSILYAPESIPYQTTLSGRGYLRFTQRFGKPSKGGSDDDKQSVISNAFYTVQVDYQKEYQDIEDPTFKKNIFDYGYVGRFNETRTSFYQQAGTDSVSGIQGVIFQGSQPNAATGTGITFDRSNMNPNLANYTTQYYNSLNGTLPTTLNQIQASNAMANGDEPNYTYGLVVSPGATQSYYSLFNSNQYALSIDASFDLQTGKVKHQIEFGLSYQQRIEKGFTARANYQGAGTQSLWQLMRGLVSSKDNGGLSLDKLNPIFVVNGHQYTLSQVQGPNAIVNPGSNDTIIYNYRNVASSYFDSSLRKQLGYNKTQDINIDALDPSTFSLGLFSADELLNSGNPFVTYYGYSYTGAQQPGNVSFNDFFTAKDANGNYTRPIGSFNPNYIAGYLLDKFTYKDIRFNVGVRIDRYSANTKVLIDPYSEYQEQPLSKVSGTLNTINGGQHPANINGNYVVYVDDNTSTSPTIVGYRNGNSWYDPTGKYVEDPTVLKQYSGGRDPQPFLTNNVKITDTNFNPNNSFTDYTPQVTIMPRVSFSFPISDVADFYAHYDIYSQRPTTGVNATAYDYYYLNQNSNQIVNNANLKPQETYDYEVGFQQKLSDRSALTLTGFYKERKNMITVVPYLYAYPTTYYTYGNRDFSTTKGMTLNYDLRRFNHLRLNIAYTLQFAEGTGSSPYSTNTGGGGQIQPNGLLQTFISAGEPNLRYVSALDYDSRHTIAATADYRFDEGEGPIVGGMRILQNAGLNFIFRVRSGEPYTAYSTAPSSPEFSGGTVVGGVNGSRLPWHYGVDMKIDKDFALNPGVKKRHDATPGIKAKRPLYLNAYLRIENLLNTREILGVYGYTGRPNDDGYLSSPFGQTYVPQQVSPQSYSDLYRLSVNNPYNYNLPRTMTLGVQFNF